MQKTREVKQAAGDRYMEVYPGELEEFTKTGDMIG